MQNVDKSNDILSNISEDEKNEILKNIENSINEEKINNNFTVNKKLGKKGVLLPLFSILFAVIVIGSSSYFFYHSFLHSEIASEQTAKNLNTISNKLITELKKSLSTQLNEINDKIIKHQKDLDSIVKEKNSIPDSINKLLSLKKKEFDSLFDNEVAEEINKLKKQNLDKNTFNLKINEFKNNRKTFYNNELEKYKETVLNNYSTIEESLLSKEAKIKEEILLEQEKLDNLKKEFSKQETEILNKYTDEKLNTIIFDDKFSNNKQDKDFIDASARLDKIVNDNKNVENIQNQLLSFYSNIEYSLKQKNYKKALDDIKIAKNLLNSPLYLKVDELSKNREKEFTYLTTLETSIIDLNNKINTDKRKEEIFSKYKDFMSLSAKEIEKGNQKEAYNYFLKALSVMDESVTGLYTIEKILASSDASIQKDISVKLNDAYANMEEEYTKKIEDLKKMYEEEKSTLLSDNHNTISSLEKKIVELQLSDNDKKNNNELTKTIKEQSLSIIEKNKELANSKNEIDILKNEINSFGKEIENFKNDVTQLNQEKIKNEKIIAFLKKEVQSINQSNKSIDSSNNQELQNKIDELNLNISEKNKEINNKIEEIEKLKTDFLSNEQSLKTKIADLSLQLESGIGSFNATTSTENEKKISSLNNQIVKMNDEIEKLKSELNKKGVVLSKTEYSKLKEENNIFESFKTRYSGYLTDYNKIISENKRNSVMNAKFRMQSFLSSRDVQVVMPNFKNHIDNFDSAFIDVGKSSVIKEQNALIEILLTYKDKEDAISHISREIANTTNNEEKEYLNNLLKFLKK